MPVQGQALLRFWSAFFLFELRLFCSSPAVFELMGEKMWYNDSIMLGMTECCDMLC